MIFIRDLPKIRPYKKGHRIKLIRNLPRAKILKKEYPIKLVPKNKLKNELKNNVSKIIIKTKFIERILNSYKTWPMQRKPINVRSLRKRYIIKHVIYHRFGLLKILMKKKTWRLKPWKKLLYHGSKIVEKKKKIIFRKIPRLINRKKIKTDSFRAIDLCKIQKELKYIKFSEKSLLILKIHGKKNNLFFSLYEGASKWNIFFTAFKQIKTKQKKPKQRKSKHEKPKQEAPVPSMRDAFIIKLQRNFKLRLWRFLMRKRVLPTERKMNKKAWKKAREGMVIKRRQHKKYTFFLQPYPLLDMPHQRISELFWRYKISFSLSEFYTKPYYLKHLNAIFTRAMKKKWQKKMARVNFSWKTARKFLIYPRTTYFLTIMINNFYLLLHKQIKLINMPRKKVILKNPIVANLLKKKEKHLFLYNYRKIFGEDAQDFFRNFSQGKLLCRSSCGTTNWKGPKRQTSTAARELCHNLIKLLKTDFPTRPILIILDQMPSGNIRHFMGPLRKVRKRILRVLFQVPFPHGSIRTRHSRRV